MKKHYFLLIFLFLCFACQLSAQITTNPAIVLQQTNSSVVITFEDSLVTALSGSSGPLYAHTGVITTASTSNTDWINVITPWPTSATDTAANTTKNELTRVGSTNKWTLTISPDINTFYGLPSGTVVTQLAFVIRNAAGTLQSSNLFVPVYQPGLNLMISTPTTNTLVTSGTATTITAYASNGTNSCNMYLYTDSTSVSNITGTTTAIASGTGVNTLTTSHTFSTPGNYYIIAKVTSNGSTQYDTTYVCVPKTQVSSARPTGLKEGTTINADGSVTFCLSLGYDATCVTASTKVYLLGDFNNFKLNNAYMMNRQAESTTYGVPTYFYWLTVKGLNATTEYAYQYYVTTGTTNASPVRVGDPYCEKILDPNNDQYINETYDIYPNLRTYPSNLASGILSCFTISPTSTYTWQYTSSFTPPSQTQLSIYEMLLRDFTTEGSVQAAIQQLDYIKSLGVNAVELMPIMEFDGNSSWGYNPNFYFAPDKAYGMKTDYQQFVDECHKRGLAVILDVVFNHTWGLSPYCMIYWDATNNRPASTNPYYNALAPHPYSVGNDINHTYQPVKSWLSRALQWWLTQYKVDGFRFDLSKGFTQTVSNGGAVDPTSTVQCSTYDASRISNIETYVSAIKAVNPKAYAILEHFCDDDEEDALAAYDSTMLWRNVATNFQQAAMGYSSSSDFSPLAAASASGGSVTLPTNRVAYAESHDEYRIGYKAITWGATSDIKDTTKVMQQLAVCGAFAFLGPGPRMMWEFGELGADYDSKDASGNNITSPVPAEWAYLNIPARKTLHDTYAKILNFRDKYPSLFSNPTAWNWEVSTSDWSNGRRIYLTNGTMSAIVLGNFTGVSGSVTAYPTFDNTGEWYELISGDSINVTNTSMTLALPEFGLQVYTNNRAAVVSTGTTIVTNNVAQIYPNPVTDYLFISGGNAVSIEIVGLGGDILMDKAIQANSVSLSSLPTGIYIGKIFFSDGSMKVTKICKK